jgi:hypothetical protein
MTDEVLVAIESLRAGGAERISVGDWHSKECRQLAKLLPSDHDSRVRALQRLAGSLLATPVMRRKESEWLAAG